MKRTGILRDYLFFRALLSQYPYRLLLLSLVIFSPPSRFPVFVAWWITKTWKLGTHYDIFDNWEQALVGCSGCTGPSVKSSPVFYWVH